MKLQTVDVEMKYYKNIFLFIKTSMFLQRSSLSQLTLTDADQRFSSWQTFSWCQNALSDINLVPRLFTRRSSRAPNKEPGYEVAVTSVWTNAVLG